MKSTLPGTAIAPPPSAVRRQGWVWGAYALVGVVSLALVAETVYVVGLTNFHVVIPGQVYRSAQLTGPQIEELTRQYGFKTIINLRGRGDGMDWYDAEARTCQSLGICHENLTFSALRLPSRTELRRLIETLDRAERPLTLHCRQGADRTGLAVATLMLLQPDVTYADARSRMGLRWGHWRWGPAGELNRFFELYEGWLAEQKISHSAATFRRWATEVYDADFCSYEVVSMTPLQEFPKAGQPTAYRIAFRNVSLHPWQFHAIRRAGVHVQSEVADVDRNVVAWQLDGMFEKTVPPGEDIEILVVLKALPAGRYRLRIDLNNGERGQFFKFGQTPIEQEFIVRE